MVPLTSLWLPIVLSAVFVFVASSIIHMALGYHRNDFRKVPGEDGVMDALRKFGIPPGDYMMPRADSAKAMQEPAFKDKVNKGPVAIITVLPNGPLSMVASLTLWFIFSLVVSLFAGYVASRSLEPGAAYLSVQQIAGCTAFIGYALALWHDSIWYRRQWGTTVKFTIDGLIYGLLTGGTFGWLWPKVV
jgi:hypothetical protein